MKIGLLGGSFNPAHAGHVHLSCEARKRLGLQQVWWIISPQNPLKSSAEIAAYALRLRKAREVARRHPFIKICEVEQRRGTRYTIDTLKYLTGSLPPSKARRAAGGMGACPQPNQYVWLMGADNLQQFHRWHRWRDIFRLMPIAVFEREVGGNALHSKAARQFFDARLKHNLHNLARCLPPRWAYVSMQKHPESATRLRNMLGMDAFLGHNEDSPTV